MCSPSKFIIRIPTARPPASDYACPICPNVAPFRTPVGLGQHLNKDHLSPVGTGYAQMTCCSRRWCWPVDGCARPATSPFQTNSRDALCANDGTSLFFRPIYLPRCPCTLMYTRCHRHRLHYSRRPLGSRRFSPLRCHGLLTSYRRV
jgi:hypothetical protein